jgi:hypothetical protein
MAVDTERWQRLNDAILTTRAVVAGLNQRADGPRQQQLRLLNEIARLQDKRRARTGTELGEGATLTELRTRGPQITVSGRGSHRPPSTYDGDLAILELRRQKSIIDSEVTALEARLAESSARLRALTELRQSCEVWARENGVALPGVEQEHVIMAVASPFPSARALRDESTGLVIEGVRG